MERREGRHKEGDWDSLKNEKFSKEIARARAIVRRANLISDHINAVNRRENGRRAI